MNIGAMEEENYFVQSWEEDGASVSVGTAMASTAGEHMTCFSMEDNYGYAIVDTGATKSMAGLRQMEWLQDEIIKELDEDKLEIDETRRTRFTYANGEKGESFGRVGVPHPAALVSHQGFIWFTMVETPSPTLLGLDHLEAADCWPRGSQLVYGDGHVEDLVRLRSGHWALPLL